jgi:hypothetical protein
MTTKWFTPVIVNGLECWNFSEAFQALKEGDTKLTMKLPQNNREALISKSNCYLAVRSWELAGSPRGVCAKCKQWSRLGLDSCKESKDKIEKCSL